MQCCPKCVIFACIDQILVFVCGWRFIFFAIFEVSSIRFY
nr:MAG TPA: hypothetical protein [Caudoviricetes sp.]